MNADSFSLDQKAFSFCNFIVTVNDWGFIRFEQNFIDIK